MPVMTTKAVLQLPVARPMYRWNHFPVVTDVPIFTPAWPAIPAVVTHAM